MTPINYNNPNDMWSNNGYDPYKGMSDEERMKAGCLQMVGMVGAIIVALLICALLGSCTTTKYVPMPEYHTDTTYITKQQRDSIWLHDSTYIKEKGDTVLIERWHTKFRDRWRMDTIYQSKRDSIPYPVEVTKEVPAELTWWQQTQMYAGDVLLLLLIGGGALFILRKRIGL